MEKAIQIYEFAKPGALVPYVDERAITASHLLCLTCRECAIGVSKWKEFTAGQGYIDSSIDEPELNHGARKELEKYSEVFGKYLILDPDRDYDKPTASKDDEERRKRAKRASKIYRNVCKDAGISLCFFSSFSAWSDFLEGKIGELELLAKAKAELEKIIEDEKR